MAFKKLKQIKTSGKVAAAIVRNKNRIAAAAKTIKKIGKK